MSSTVEITEDRIRTLVSQGTLTEDMEHIGYSYVEQTPGYIKIKADLIRVEE